MTVSAHNHWAWGGAEDGVKSTADCLLMLIRAAGGDVIFHGPALSCPIAPPGESWDEVLIVRYPSRGAFLSMVMAPSYQRETVHRTAGLLDARLICAREG